MHFQILGKNEKKISTSKTNEKGTVKFDGEEILESEHVNIQYSMTFVAKVLYFLGHLKSNCVFLNIFFVGNVINGIMVLVLCNFLSLAIYLDYLILLSYVARF